MARKNTTTDEPVKPARSRKTPVKVSDPAKAVAPKKPAVRKPAAKKPPAKDVMAKARAARRPVKKAPSEIDQPDNGIVVPEEPILLEGDESSSKVQKDDFQAQFEALSRRHQLFIETYLTTMNSTTAAIRAGYSAHGSTAATMGSRLRNDPNLAPIIEAMLADELREIAMSRERVLGEIEAMAKADQNELVELRRVCCRYCYGGEDFAYMETPAENRKRVQDYEKVCAEAAARDEKSPPEFDESIVTGFNGTLSPHPDCPECWGEGVERVFFKDTRYLSDGARALYAGAHWGKDGLKVNTYSKESALDKLAKYHKLYEDKTEVNLIMPATDELDAIYREAMEKTKAGAEKVIGRSGRLGNVSGD